MKEFYKKPIPQQERWLWEDIERIVIKECGEKLIPLSLYPEKILVRPQYVLQGINGALIECFARESVLKKLVEASKMLPEGFKIVIFDSWRPVKVQKELFDRYKKETAKSNPEKSNIELENLVIQFVAFPSCDPQKPSPHSTGGAIDLTIADSKGYYLDMGSEFDETTERSRTNYYENRGSRIMKIAYNRRLLYNIMTNVGFTNYPREWWHFDYGNQNWAWKTSNQYAIYGKAEPYLRWLKES